MDDNTNGSDSYKWDNPNSKTTFPATLWVSAILDVIYFELSTTKVEEKYTQKMPTINAKTNNMYINSLLKKMGILTKPQVKLSNYFSEIEVENWIVNRINEKTDLHYEETTNGMKKLISEWRSHQANNKTKEFGEEELANIDQELKKRIFSSTNDEWDVVEKLDDNIVELGTSKSHILDLDIDNREKVGRLGESIFNNMLVKKFGVENVVWKSNIDKFSPYDFEVELDGIKSYFEVKSTIRSSKSFFISSNELAFRKKVENYSLVTITNVPTETFTPFPNVVEFKNPEFEISMDKMGIKNNKILITPTHFRGII